jgi:TetR/AcrR family transcriptional regulator, mexJK operon transcriptional repressor
MTETNVEVDSEPRPRSAQKRRAILEAGTVLFLRDGYLATSMDEIASAAGVSKQTVYAQFGDKESLFCKIVADVVDEVADPVSAEVARLADSKSLAVDLRRLAHHLLAQVVQPRVMQLRRLVIGEAGRFPELGGLFYEHGPGRTIEGLATTFERLAAKGALVLRDPKLAAAHFNWLVMSIPVNRLMFSGDEHLPSVVEMKRYAEEGVRAFLAAYGNPDAVACSTARPRNG